MRENTVTETEESLGGVYSSLKGAFSAIGEQWRRVADLTRQEAIEPLRTVSASFKKVGS